MDYMHLQNGSDIRGVAMDGVPGEAVTLTEDAVVIRREKICDNCTPEKTIALDEFFDGLTPERQQALVSHLARKLMSRKGGVRFGRA